MWQWLKKEAGFRGMILGVLLLPLASIAWSVFVGVLGIRPAQTTGQEVMEIMDALGWWILLFFVIAAAMEEVLFRLPLSICVRAKLHPAAVIGILVALSAVFGYIHTYSMEGVVRQGMVGLMLSVFYLKCGGANGKFVKPFLAATMAHAANNSLVLLLMLWARGGG